MSTTVSYKGNTLTTVSNNTKTLETEGKYLEADIILTDVSGGITPTGNINITSSGQTDVTNYATATVAAGTEGTPTATKGAVSSHSVTVTPSVTNTAGYISGGTHTGTGVSVSASELVSGTYNVSGSGTADVTNYASINVPSGSVSPPASVAVSDATVSVNTSTGMVTLTKSNVGNPPTITAGYVSSATGSTSSVMAQGALTMGTEGTPTATKSAVSNHAVTVTPSVTNSTGWITGSTKTGTAVTVTASELVSGSETKTENGTYDVTNLAEIVVDVSGGGSSTIQVGTKTATLSAAASSISFTGLSGNPTSFAVTSSANVATNTNGVTAVTWDGTNLHGQTMTTQVTADTGFTKSYSSGTLTITATTAQFQANEYKLVYTYNGSSSDIHTADVQVGSGATSITFSSLSGRPIYWSCIFLSDFSASSGYQRVIDVVNDGTSIYGMAMDSSAKAQTSWSQTYSGGSLTISSTSTNNGGYFHQPGNYHLVYAVDDSAPQYQTKTVSPSTTQQTVLPDSGYDALESVVVNAMPSMTLPSSASSTSSGTSKATITPGSSAQYLNIPTGYNATAQYYTIGASGGGGSVSVATTTWSNSTNTTTSHQFTGLLGTPKFAVLRCTTTLSRSSNSTNYFVADIVWDGTNTVGHSYRRSNGSYANKTTGYSVSVSGTSITFTSSGTSTTDPVSFYNGTYELRYVY